MTSATLDRKLTDAQLETLYEKLDRLYTAALNNNHRWAAHVLYQWAQVENEMVARGLITLEEIGA